MKSTPNDLDSIIKTAYSPVYPVVTSQIIDAFGIKEGICIDIGAGPAPLSISLAKATSLKIYALDISDEILGIAKKNINNEALEERITPILGDVHNLPFDDEFADLIVSRGSMFFWNDLESGFKEIYRVLKHGGGAYIGGGFGNGRIKEKIKNQLGYSDVDTKKNNYKKPPKIDKDSLELAVNNAGINEYVLINDDTGLWVILLRS